MGDGMGGWGRKRGIRWGIAVAAAGMVVGLTGCRPTDTEAAAQPSVTRSHGTSGASAGQPAGPGGACVFVKPDGAQKFGHTGWGFRITGTDRWVYGAVENPTNALYIAPGHDIGAWHAEGTYARMLGDMSRDAHFPGRSTHPYSRYRCTSSSTSDVTAARAMIRTVEGRGFLVGVDPETGDLGSRDCLDATYDVLRAYRTRHLTPAYQTEIPNMWVETLVLWSDHTLTPR
ncbi:hypothetical protein OG762_11915 [Streptomyces sp. NBC_01136]|uniref:hypothetical protein n=1 Tax=unclassified Streptomyces TaxID=2593676 RepID=UPI00324ED6EA|nr:hypothetical protein OG762_11915 [Streptomyces sp. NBC_01136]